MAHAVAPCGCERRQPARSAGLQRALMAAETIGEQASGGACMVRPAILISNSVPQAMVPAQPGPFAGIVSLQ
jgi:hypothetical protein